MKRFSLQLNDEQIEALNEFVFQLGPGGSLPKTIFLLADVRYKTGEVKVMGWADEDAIIAQENIVAAIKETLVSKSDGKEVTMSIPNLVEFEAEVMMLDNGDNRETEFRILNVSGSDIPVELLVYLNSLDGQENEREAFDHLPLGFSRVKVSALYDYGDRSVGIFEGWSVENVERMEDTNE